MQHLLSKITLFLALLSAHTLTASQNFDNRNLYGREEGPQFKVILLGSASVGKTALFTRYIDDTFAVHSQSTIGLDFRRVRKKIGNQWVALNMWDTAGHERFRAITASYFRGTQGVFLVYDICNRESFNSLKSEWIPLINDNTTEGINPVLFIIANKRDLIEGEDTTPSARAVSLEEGIQFAQEHKAHYFETSAKEGTNVSEIFEKMAESLLKLPADQKTSRGSGLSSNTSATPGCCSID